MMQRKQSTAQYFSKMFSESVGIDNQDLDPHLCDSEVSLGDKANTVAVTLQAFEYDIPVRPRSARATTSFTYDIPVRPQSAQATGAFRTPTKPATPKPKADPRPKSASVQRPVRQVHAQVPENTLPDADMSHDFGRRLAGSRLASIANAKQAPRPPPQAQSVAPISERSMSVMGRENGIAFMDEHAVKVEEASFYQGSAASTLRFRHHRLGRGVTTEAAGVAPRPESPDMDGVRSAPKPEATDMTAGQRPLGSAPRYQRSRHNGPVLSAHSADFCEGESGLPNS
jgi:hypothetical protein